MPVAAGFERLANPRAPALQHSPPGAASDPTASELRHSRDSCKPCDDGAVAVRFECVTNLAMPPAEAFDLSLSVAAHLASMANSREQAIGPTSAILGPGDEITWRAWHFGVPWRLTSRITAFDRPHRFVDEQVHGPFHRFHHEHRFEPISGGSLMTDIVEFEAPAGWLGGLMERLVLASYMRSLIEERNRYLAARLAR